MIERFCSDWWSYIICTLAINLSENLLNSVLFRSAAQVLPIIDSLTTDDESIQSFDDVESNTESKDTDTGISEIFIFNWRIFYLFFKISFASYILIFNNAFCNRQSTNRVY